MSRNDNMERSQRKDTSQRRTYIPIQLETAQHSKTRRTIRPKLPESRQRQPPLQENRPTLLILQLNWVASAALFFVMLLVRSCSWFWAPRRTALRAGRRPGSREPSPQRAVSALRASIPVDTRQPADWGPIRIARRSHLNRDAGFQVPGRRHHLQHIPLHPVNSFTHRFQISVPVIDAGDEPASTVV